MCAWKDTVYVLSTLVAVNDDRPKRKPVTHIGHLAQVEQPNLYPIPAIAGNARLGIIYPHLFDLKTLQLINICNLLINRNISGF